jgi:EmrB/QacA subfamily drug resistance transporter
MPRASRTPTADAPATGNAVLSHRQILLIISGLMAGMFLSSLDQTVVGTSMRTIADDLDGLALQASVTTAYLITSTVATPIYGKLSDIFGRRPLFLIAITIFLAGSLLCGLANTMYELAGYRAVQGLGAGGLMALQFAIMGDILAPRQRAKYQGYFLAVFAASSVLGPLIGGLFSGADEIAFIAGWRWIFLINIPVGIVALVLVLRFLHVPHTRRRVRIDWWGAATIVLGLVPVLLVAENGRVWGWDSPISIACYVIGGIGIAAFIISERIMGDDALIPLKLFRHPNFSMVTVLGVLTGFGMFGAMMTLPLYLQLVHNATPTESGFLLLPMILGLMISSITSGQIISRTGAYRRFPVVGSALITTGFVWLALVTGDGSLIQVMVGMLLVGLGIGLMMQTLMLASQNSVGPHEMGVATSATTFFRQIGGTLGVAVLFSILFARIPDAIAEAFRNEGVRADLQAALADPDVVSAPGNSGILELIGSAQSGDSVGGALDGDTSFLTGADPRLTAPFVEGFAQATTAVYWVSAVVVAVAFVLSFFLKAAPLRKVSAIQEVADARAAAEREAAIVAQQAADQTGSMMEPGLAVTTGAIPVADPHRGRRDDDADM